MSKKLFTETLMYDGERHIKSELCWCGPKYNAQSDTYFHIIEFEKEANVSFRAEKAKEYRA